MPALLMLTGPLAGRRFPVEGPMTLGRSPSCEISLNDSKVSRKHAQLSVDAAGIRIEDLGSRNSTTVNGRKVEGLLALASGDYVQIGDTTILFDPPTRASLSDRIAEAISQVSVEEALPRVGVEAAVLSLSSTLFTAGSEAAVLRRTTDELARALGADKAASVVGEAEGLITASIVGAASVDVPRSLAHAALSSRQVSVWPHELCAPLMPSGGSALGLLYAERKESFTEAERALAATLGRIAGEALAAVRLRSRRGLTDDVLVGSSRGFKRALEEARRAAVNGAGVALQGERGVGRGALAKLIHSLSPRSLGPLLEIDCRRDPNDVAAELFGRPGRGSAPPLASVLLRADGGTVLLRQFEMLPRATMDRLAPLVERKVAPGARGGEEPVDVRLFATISEPMSALVQRGEVDPRLAQVISTEIAVSPLRERSGDIVSLFEDFLARATTLVQMPTPTLSPQAGKLLTDYTWPGNVLELELVARRLALLYPGMEISALRLPLELQQGTPAKARSLEQLLSAVEREAISEALREAKGKKIRAAELLAISRPTLDKKIEDYKLTVTKSRAGSE